jgi:lysozyme
LHKWLAILAIFAPDVSLASDYHRPWNHADAVIVIDPYYANPVDWRRVVTDKKVKAVIHKASDGQRIDPKFVERAAQARKVGLLWGAYHLGRPGDPIRQANLLLSQARKTHATFLALDIEGEDARKWMSLKDATRFIQHIHQNTGRYPAIYVNRSVYRSISEKYGSDSIFARCPLWIARFGPTLSLPNKRVWKSYTLWQFSSEINCKKDVECLYRVPGTRLDMDVNVFRGSVSELRKMFE